MQQCTTGVHLLSAHCAIEKSNFHINRGVRKAKVHNVQLFTELLQGARYFTITKIIGRKHVKM